MKELQDASVQCVVTSPPYWGLRQYAGGQDLVWGGNNHHNHEWITADFIKEIRTGQGLAEWSKDNARGGGKKPGNVPVLSYQLGQCQVCGAWRGAYGLEPTPGLYIEHTVEILREIRRILRPDGVVFWNIGDSYAGSWGAMSQDTNNKERRAGFNGRPPQSYTQNLKPKDLCLIPQRVAIALQEDGWWIRSMIIWSKPNPMPESVKDRPTNAYENIIMLTKSAKYYWNQDAVREPYTEPMNRWGGDKLIANGESTWDIGTGQSTYRDRNMRPNDSGRNIRDVWEFPTQPYPEAHFAVFPEKLPELCIKAASKECDLILDPFAGSGTTLWVAKKLNRKAVGYELSGEYCQLIEKRNRQQALELTK